MAIVRITDTLVKLVHSKVDETFRTHLARAQEWDCPVDADTIYNRIFSPWLTAMQALPDPMLPKMTKFTIGRVHNKLANREFPLSPSRSTPRVPQSTHVASPGYFHGNYDLLQDDAGTWNDLAAYVDERHMRIEAVLEKIKTVKDGVSEVLKAHSTLAPALKAWPPLWELLPDHVQAKHKQIVTRNKTITDINVDVSALTGAITYAKLTK